MLLLDCKREPVKLAQDLVCVFEKISDAMIDEYTSAQVWGELHAGKTAWDNYDGAKQEAFCRKLATRPRLLFALFSADIGLPYGKKWHKAAEQAGKLHDWKDTMHSWSVPMLSPRDLIRLTRDHLRASRR